MSRSPLPILESDFTVFIGRFLSIKKARLIAGFFVLICFSAYSQQTNTDPSSLIKASKTIGFMENKGQFSATNSGDASFVLFKASLPNLNVWVTTSGLTYQFYSTGKTGHGNSIQHKSLTYADRIDSVEFEWSRIDMVLKNATIRKENVIVEGAMSGVSNFYYPHCNKGSGSVSVYSKVTIKEIYKGIDWVLSSNNGRLEHDFIIHPNADPNQIKLIYEGNGDFDFSDNSISFSTELGLLKEGELLCYQNNETEKVESKYLFSKNDALVLKGAGIQARPTNAILNENQFSYEVSLQIGDYSKDEILVIDPELVWGTYFGNLDAEIPKSITCDRKGNIYITGQIISFEMTSLFPVVNWDGAYNQSSYGGNMADAFVMRFNSEGALVWSTFYGGADYDQGNSIACDKHENVYVTGLMVMDPGVVQTTFPLKIRAGAYNQQDALVEALNAFLLQFDTNTGECLWSTFCAEGEARSLVCDIDNNVYITGGGEVSPAQVWDGAYNNSEFGGGFDIFILRFDPSGNLTWATNFGGPDYEEGIDIATDNSGNIYITGSAHEGLPVQAWGDAYFQPEYTGGFGDGCILRFSNTGALDWSTFYTGTEQCTNIELDGNENIYVTGYTSQFMDGVLQTKLLDGAYNQPLHGGGDYDACIMKFDNEGVLSWSTHFGGEGDELIGNFSTGAEMTIDLCNNVYVSMTTTDPSTLYTFQGCSQYFYPNPIMPYLRSAIMKFNPQNEVIWSTPYGETGNAAGWGFQLAVDLDNNLYISKALYEPSQMWPLDTPSPEAFYDEIPDLMEDLYIGKFIPDSNQSYTLEQTGNVTTVTVDCGHAPFDYYWSNGTQILDSPSPVCQVTDLGVGTNSVIVVSNCLQSVELPVIITSVNDELDLQELVSVFPNPSSDLITFSTSMHFDEMDVRIFDIAGRKLFEMTGGQNASATVSLANFTAGIYFVQTTIDSTTTITKLVKE
jgi:hypothetical protein